MHRDPSTIERAVHLLSASRYLSASPTSPPTSPGCCLHVRRPTDSPFDRRRPQKANGPKAIKGINPGEDGMGKEIYCRQGGSDADWCVVNGFGADKEVQVEWKDGMRLETRTRPSGSSSAAEFTMTGPPCLKIPGIRQNLGSLQDGTEPRRARIYLSAFFMSMWISRFSMTSLVARPSSRMSTWV